MIVRLSGDELIRRMELCSAMRNGDRDAALDLILDPRVNDGVGGPDGPGRMLLNAEYHIPKIRSVVRKMAKDDVFAAEAMLDRSLILGKAEKADEWIDRCLSLGSGYAKWRTAVDTLLSGGSTDAALDMLTESAEDCWQGCRDLARLSFCSPYLARDDRRTLELLIRASRFKVVKEDSLALFDYMLGTERPEEPEEPPEGNGGGMGYPVEENLWDSPEWVALRWCAGCDHRERTRWVAHANPRGGFEGRIFSMTPVSKDSGYTRAALRPNLVLKPTGLRMGWGVGDFRGAWMTEPLTCYELARVWRACAEDARDLVGGSL